MSHKYPKVTLSDVLKSIWKAVKPTKWWILLAIVAIAGATVLELITPLLFRDFFNTLDLAANKVTGAEALFGILFSILLLNLAAWLSYRVATIANVIYQSEGMAALRTQAFDYLLNHSHSFFANNFTGSLTQRISRYARAFESLADRLVWNVIPLLIRITGTIIVVWSIKPIISWIILIWTFLFLGFNYAFAKFRLKYDLVRTEADTKTTGVLSDAITNHNTIQIFSGFGTESDHFKHAVVRQSKATRFVWGLDVAAESVQALLIILMEFFIFYFAIEYWQAGIVNLGIFILLQAYVLGLGHRLWDFSRVIRDLYHNFADAKEMVEILNLPHEIKDLPDAKEFKAVKGDVEFKNVIFSFNETRTVLNKLNLKIAGGEKVALIGPSGAGKSTVVRLILRLYEIGGGHILIDGQDIQHVTQDSLHRAVSLVPQDPILFHRTLMENIRYGRRDATDEEVIEAAKKAHCHEFIKDLPQQYQTYVGERGIKLSGGERQRVAIARAILKNAPVLILDEATSSLDSHSEVLIQDALEKLMEGKTTIVIAHRLSTIRKMDRIIALREGKVVEEGSHDALLQKPDSLYKKLWDLQAGGFIIDEELEA